MNKLANRMALEVRKDIKLDPAVFDDPIGWLQDQRSSPLLFEVPQAVWDSDRGCHLDRRSVAHHQRCCSE